MNRPDYRLFTAALCLLFFTPVAGQTALHQAQDTLSSEQSWKYPFLSEGDLVEWLPGVLTTATGIPGNWQPFGINGDRPSRALLLYNGMPLTDPWTGHSDLSLLPGQAFHRFSLYTDTDPFGIQPFTGMINVTTRRLTTAKPETRIFYRSGSGKFNDLDISFAQKVTPALTLQTGVDLRNNSYPDSLRYLKKQALRAAVTYEPNAEFRLEYTVLQDRTKLHLPYTISLPGDTLTLIQPRRLRTRYDHLLRTAFSLPFARTELNVSSTSDRFQFYERTGSRRIIPVRSLRAHLQQQLHGRLSAFSWGSWLHFTGIDPLAAKKRYNSYQTFFMQYAGTRTAKIEYSLRAGAHISGNRKAYLTFLGRIGFRASASTSAAVVLSRKYREPSLAEKFGIPVTLLPCGSLTAGQFIPGAREQHVRPESMLSLAFPVSLTAGRLRLNARPYYHIVDDPIYLHTHNSIITSANGAGEASFGFSGSLFADLIRGFDVHCVLNVKNSPAASSWSRTPGLFGRTAVSWQHTFFSGDLHLRATLNLQYTSSYSFYPGLFIPAEETQVIPRRTTLQGKIDAVVIRNARVSVEMDNILDAGHPGCIWSGKYGRTYRLTLLWIFLE